MEQGSGGGDPTISLDALEFLFFDSAREKQVMTSILFELEIYQETEATCFFEKMLYANMLKVKKVSLNVPERL